MWPMSATNCMVLFAMPIESADHVLSAQIGEAQIGKGRQ